MFFAGITTMIAMMYFGMSRSGGRLSPPWSLLANGMLLAQFAVLHSFLLSKGGRTVLARLAPAGFGRDLASTTYVAIASTQTLLLFAGWSPSGIVWWQAEGAALVVLTALYAASWLLLGKAMMDAGLALQAGWLGWLAVFRGTKPVYPPMPESGLFRIVRQPIYVAFALTLWTVPTWTPDQLAVAVSLTAYCVAGPLLKESRFADIHGERFARYQARVPFWLPWPRPAAPSRDRSRRNDMRDEVTIYSTYARNWWDGSQRFLRLLQNIVPARMRHFTQVVGAWNGKSVLEVGCGGGFMAEALARAGADVIGVDPSGPAVLAAREHARLENLPIDYHVGVGERIPLPDEAVDCVVCVDVLEHVDSVDLVLDEITRVLKPGGLFLFDTINRTLLAKVVIVGLGESVLRLLPRGTHDPAKFITPAELSRKLVDRGYEVGPIVGLAPVGIGWRLDFTFGRFPSTQIMYMGHARKARSPLR